MLGKGNVEPSYERAVEHFTKAKKNGGEDADKSLLYLEFLEEHKRVPDNYMELAFCLEEKAKEKAKEARRNAIQAYLEAKKIKKTYLLDNYIDNDSDSDSDFITEFEEELHEQSNSEQFTSPDESN